MLAFRGNLGTKLKFWAHVFPLCPNLFELTTTLDATRLWPVVGKYVRKYFLQNYNNAFLTLKKFFSSVILKLLFTNVDRLLWKWWRFTIVVYGYGSDFDRVTTYFAHRFTFLRYGDKKLINMKKKFLSLKWKKMPFILLLTLYQLLFSFHESKFLTFYIFAL